MKNDIGKVETRWFTLAPKGETFRMRKGEVPGPVVQAYEIYGQLNQAKDNAILLFHAWTGSQHAAGHNADVPGVGKLWTEECHIGWWDDFVGPGKALDTERFCVICANYIGGCYGSTGPSSISPLTNKPFGSSFPHITFADVVDAQMKLVDHLGILKLHAVVGGSIGGMMCLSLATRYPDRVGIVIPIASGMAVTSLQRIQTFEQIYAIEYDPNFKGGDYYDGPHPDRTLALARMISHKNFISLEMMRHRARTEIASSLQKLPWYHLTNPLESYMLYQGNKFVKRFDANSYLRIADAWQQFNLLEEAGLNDVDELFVRCRGQQYLVFTINSDVCFWPEEQEELVSVLKQASVENMRVTVHSEKGHDSFLLEPALYTPHLAYVLEGKTD
ncbi:MAG: homoserine O-acetyltransferase [bacterium]